MAVRLLAREGLDNHEIHWPRQTPINSPSTLPDTTAHNFYVCKMGVLSVNADFRGTPP